jgi:cyclase
MTSLASTPVRNQPYLRELAEGIHAYIQPPGGWCVSNAGIIAGDDGAIVVDSLATERRTLALRDAVDALTPSSRRTLVNTHHHGDHVFGNHLFGPDTTIVAHELTRVEMAETGLALKGLWPDVDWGDVRVTLPDVTFEERLTLRVGGRRVELIHVGPAHTSSDVVVWIEEEGVLFAGDVLFSGSAPFVLMGSVAGSLTAVETLTRLEPRTIVCGHGEVTGPQVLEETGAYLSWIEWMAAEGAARGLTPLEMARAADTERFDHLLEPERVVGNLHRAYAERVPGVQGRPLDVEAVFGEMVEYNDGRLPTCLA